MEDRITTLLDPSPVMLRRKSPKTGRLKEVDIRPFLESVVLGDDYVQMELRLIDGTTARPAEVLAELGLEAERIQHRVRRREIRWQ